MSPIHATQNTLKDTAWLFRARAQNNTRGALATSTAVTPPPSFRPDGAGDARPMIDARVLVLGGGAIGGITAAKLVGEVRRVVVLDTNEEHVARLRQPGLTYEEEGAEHTVALEAAGSADELDGEFDFVLVAVKSPFHQAALEPLAASGKVASFVSLGNGLIQDRMAHVVGLRSPAVVHRRVGRDEPRAGTRGARHDRADGGR